MEMFKKAAQIHIYLKPGLEKIKGLGWMHSQAPMTLFVNALTHDFV